MTTARPSVLTTDSEYAATARSLAARLVQLAVISPDGSGTWRGDEVDPSTDPARLRHVTLDESLMFGRAGVALALAACSRLPLGDPDWAALAIATVRSAVSSARSRVGRTDPLGWSDGALGVASAAEAVATLVGDEELSTAAAELALAAVNEAAGVAEASRWPDLVGGVAGILIGVACARLPGDSEEIRQATIDRLVAILEAGAVRDATGTRWSTGDLAPLAGLAHGASGIALALHAAGRPELVAEALRWEEGLYDPTCGGWPDLRTAEQPPGVAWCHGALGIGVVASCMSGSSDVRARATAHATYLRAVEASRLHRPAGSPFDGTLCHGLGGVVELHLMGATAWPEVAGEHLTQARRVAQHLTRAGEADHPVWTCGIIDGGRNPNLQVGIAGVALTLARCHDPSVAPSPADPSLGRLTAASPVRLR